MKNLFINFMIAVMIFSGISLVHAQESPADKKLEWFDWPKEKWRDLNSDQVDEFFLTLKQ